MGVHRTPQGGYGGREVPPRISCFDIRKNLQVHLFFFSFLKSKEKHKK